MGDLMKSGAAVVGFADLDTKPFMVLTEAFLAWLNYRGVFMTLTINLVITFLAFMALVVFFFAVDPLNQVPVLQHKALLTDLPYG